MSLNLNQVTICGRLVRDPEKKATPTGQTITELSLATNHVYTTKEGEKKESVEYHNIVLFGKQAENTALYLKKGDEALVTGRLQTRSWEDSETKKKMYRTEIVGDGIQFGSKAPVPKAGNTNVPYDVPGEGDIPRPEDIPF